MPAFAGCAHEGRGSSHLAAPAEATGGMGGAGPAAAPYAWSILRHRCQGCHVLPDPRKHTRARWVRGVTMMERKLRLPAADWDSLLALWPEPPDSSR